MSSRVAVLVTGGSSYLGEFVVRELLRNNACVYAAVRSDLAGARVASLGAIPVQWDLRESVPSIKAEVLLHLAGLAFGRSLVEWKRVIGFQRTVCVSSASAVVAEHPKSALVQRQEEQVRKGCVDAVVVRPTMIFGGVRDHNVRLLHALVQRLPAVPILRGGGKLQPVLVDDLAAILTELALGQSEPSQTVTYGGAEALQVGRIVGDLARLCATRQLPITLSVGTVARIARKAGCSDRNRVLHAASMLSTERSTPDPNSWGLQHQATPWPSALSLAVARYRRGHDTREW